MDKFKTYANSFQAIAKPGLESIRTLLNVMGNPQKNLKFIHVAGTNGKGSVCAFLQEILTRSGIKTGKYTSPNLISVCERISVDGKNISETEMENLLREMEKYCDALPENISPTQFEIWTAAAFLYFSRSECEIVVLETGLGGEKDATNIIDTNICSVITKISRDHVEYLGNDINEIAHAKAGIIKKGGFCVTTSNNHEIYNVLEEAAMQNQNEIFTVNFPMPSEYCNAHEIFSYKTLENMKSGLCGINQIENACLAAETALRLGINPEYIVSGIENASNPARFEMIGETIIYDGAHNPDGAQSLADNLNRYFKETDKVFIFSCMKDKDIQTELKILKNVGIKKMYTVKVKDNPRTADANLTACEARLAGICAEAMPNLEDALNAAKSENALTVICGSLYLYKDLSEIFPLTVS